LFEILIEIDPEINQDYVELEDGRRTLYVIMLRALYGMMMSSVLYYMKFQEDLKSIGFQGNPYDPCVANRTVKGNQGTVTWNVDDLKSSHANSKVNDGFLSWLERKYAADSVGKVMAIRGLRHDYLGINLDFSVRGKHKLI